METTPKSPGARTSEPQKRFVTALHAMRPGIAFLRLISLGAAIPAWLKLLLGGSKVTQVFSSTAAVLIFGVQPKNS